MCKDYNNLFAKEIRETFTGLNKEDFHVINDHYLAEH